MKTILFQGDSITDAWRDKGASALPDGTLTAMHYGAGYVNKVAGKLMLDHPDKNLNIINRGISGNRIVDLYARWKIDAVNLKPDIISILIGVNDVWHEFASGNGVEPDRFEQVYDMLLEWTKKVLPEVKLVIGQPFALRSHVVTDDFYDTVQIYAGIAEKMAEKYNAPFVRYQDIFNEAAKKRENTLYLVDGVHPSIAGAELMSRALTPVIEDLL